ncbi:hypothetical protein ACQJ1M_24190, partial [Klebsiella pneumoniae]
GTVCVVGKMRDLILQLSKSSIYSTKPPSHSIATSFSSTYAIFKFFIAVPFANKKAPLIVVY